MAEDLQALLEQINKEGLAKAETQKNELLAQAKAEATEIVSTAKQEAARLLAEAQRECQLLQTKSEESLRLAARDVKLSLRHELELRVPEAIKALLSKELDNNGLSEILGTLCTNFLSSKGQQEDLTILLPAAQLSQVEAAVKGKLSENLRSRCDFAPSASLKNGFKLQFKGDDVLYDFSDEALSEALNAHLGQKLVAVLSVKD